VRLAGRVPTEPGALELFAQSLGGDDEVALEATGNALEIARIIEQHVGRVVLANPKAVKGITRAGAKTDKIDARTLAQLLAGGFLPAVWLPDEQTRVLRRRISARAQLVRQRTRAKNQVQATLIGNLMVRPPGSRVRDAGLAPAPHTRSADAPTSARIVPRRATNPRCLRRSDSGRTRKTSQPRRGSSRHGGRQQPIVWLEARVADPAAKD